MLRTFEITNLNFTNAESTDLIKYLNILQNCTISGLGRGEKARGSERKRMPPSSLLTPL